MGLESNRAGRLGVGGPPFPRRRSRFPRAHGPHHHKTIAARSVVRWDPPRTMKLALLVFALLLGLAPLAAATPAPARDRVGELEWRVGKLERSFQSLAGPAFLAGVIAALWAQNTRRNAWLWFFLGAIFVPITLIVLLYLNARDRRRQAVTAAPGPT